MKYTMNGSARRALPRKPTPFRKPNVQVWKRVHQFVQQLEGRTDRYRLYLPFSNGGFKSIGGYYFTSLEKAIAAANKEYGKGLAEGYLRVPTIARARALKFVSAHDAVLARRDQLTQKKGVK